jgi:ATP-dependent Clp protease protease subunit
MKRRLNDIYVKHTDQSYDVIERTLDRDYFMTAEQAQEFGLIDKVLTQREETEFGISDDKVTA